MQATGSSIEERVFYIDLEGVTDREGLQARLAEVMGDALPACYGRNLDALHDVLTSSGSGWNIIFYHDAALKRSQPKYCAALARLCAEACEETPGLKIRFFRG